jgi:hypothetical protein
MIGGVLAVTEILSVVVAVGHTVTHLKRKSGCPSVLPKHEASMSAVMVPLLLSMFDMVTPAVGFALLTVRERLPAVESASATVAMVDFPRCRTSNNRDVRLPAVTVGIALTVKAITASVVAPQLSDARIVIVCGSDRRGIRDRDYAS